MQSAAPRVQLLEAVISSLRVATSMLHEVSLHASVINAHSVGDEMPPRRWKCSRPPRLPYFSGVFTIEPNIALIDFTFLFPFFRSFFPTLPPAFCSSSFRFQGFFASPLPTKFFSFLLRGENRFSLASTEGEEKYAPGLHRFFLLFLFIPLFCWLSM